MRRSILILSFLLWIGIIITIYYVVQNPSLLNTFTGLVGTSWALLVAAFLLFSAYGIGARILSWLGVSSIDGIDRLLLGCGVGLGALGLLSLGLSAARIVSTPVFFFLLLSLTAFFLLKGDLKNVNTDLNDFAAHWSMSFSQFGLISKILIGFAFLFSFLLTLAPQFEAFDALLYHLAQPARVIQDGGLLPVNVPHFWFPNLTENVYLWALAMRSERAAQLMHWAWGVLAALLLWHWAVRAWNLEIGRKTLLLLAGIPSLPMLASWAYADMALVFYAVATFYTITRLELTKSLAWLLVAGVMAGLAMGVKYTSFTVPLTSGLLILFWGRTSFSQAVVRAAQFSLVAGITAVSWYARNAIVMGNPFYPFAFGGRYWDSLRAEWYAGIGTGIGWNPLRLFLLPLNATLGIRDQNFFDGRIGPLFLILAPVALWVLFSRANQESDRGLSLQAIGLFAALSFAAWTLGVIKSISLWQARLLFPAMIPFAIPTALAWDSLNQLDTPKLRISFLSNALMFAVITLTIFDNAIFVIQRNPLAMALGAQSREGYIARVNPSYAGLMQMMDTLPLDAYLYSLFEPRSYGLPRRTQPDPINDNFAHDLHLHETPSEIIRHWKTDGYTHILVYERGLAFLEDSTSDRLTPTVQAALQETLARLELLDQTPDKVYTIYRIP